MTTKQTQPAVTTTMTTGYTTNNNMETAMNKLTSITQAVYGWTRRANAGFAAFLVVNATAFSIGTPTLPVRLDVVPPSVNHAYAAMKVSAVEAILSGNEAPAGNDAYATMKLEVLDALLAGNEAPEGNETRTVNEAYASMKAEKIEDLLAGNEAPAVDEALVVNEAYADMKFQQSENLLAGNETTVNVAPTVNDAYATMKTEEMEARINGLR